MPVADGDMVVDNSNGLYEGKTPNSAGNENILPASLSSPAADILKNFYHTKRVGNYLIGRKLGEGSFAKVREGLHALTGEKVSALRSSQNENATGFWRIVCFHVLCLTMAVNLINFSWFLQM